MQIKNKDILNKTILETMKEENVEKEKAIQILMQQITSEMTNIEDELISDLGGNYIDYKNLLTTLSKVNNNLDSKELDDFYKNGRQIPLMGKQGKTISMIRINLEKYLNKEAEYLYYLSHIKKSLPKPGQFGE